MALRSEYLTKVKPYLQDIERYHRCGVTEAQLCEFYKVGKTSWALYKKQNPELAEILCKAKKDLKADLINQAYKVAMGEWVDEEKVVVEQNAAGEIVTTKTTTHHRYVRPDAGMIQFLLINRFPSEFARDPQAIELRRKALELADRGVALPDNLGGI